MKYVVTHAGRERHVSVIPRDDGRWDITLGDRTVVADLRDGVSLAAESIDSGMALSKVEGLARITSAAA